MIRANRWLMLLLAIPILLLCKMQVQAAEDELPSTKFNIQQLEEGKYKYELPGVGSFETNVMIGETCKMAYFEFEDTLTYDLMYNEDIIKYESGDFLYANGVYTLYVFPANDDLVYGEMEFAIENEMNAENTYENDWDSLMNTEKQEIAPEVSFNKKLGQIQYSIHDEVVLCSTVPNEGICVEEATVIISDGLAVSLFLDGEEESVSSDSTYTTPGHYRMEVQYFNAGGENMEISSFSFYFTVISKRTNAISLLNPPEGFCIAQVLRDDLEQEVADDFFFLSVDGQYEVRYVSKEDASVAYVIRFYRDTVAPFLTFDQEDLTAAKPPLMYSVDDSTAIIKAIKKGDVYVYEDNTIHQGGMYTLNAIDQAGNVRSYSVFVRNIYDFGGIEYIILFSLIIVIVIGWVIYTRKKGYRV